MKYLLIPLLLLSSCTHKPKFSYDQTVEVKHGFYTGCRGWVKAYYDYSDQYLIVFDNCDDKIEDIDASDLE